MFGILRIITMTIRTVLNAIFFPAFSLSVLVFAKLVYDLSGIFHKHTWQFPITFFNWFFGDYKAWDIQILSSPHISQFCYYGAFVVLVAICLANLFGITSLFIKVLRANSGIRNALNREDDYNNRILSAFDNLAAKYRAKYKKEPNVKVKIIDSKIKNAVIFSDNLIILTTELLENSDDEELEGVIAHEWGHMHNGDTLYNQLNFTNTVVSNNIESGAIIKSIYALFHIVNIVPFLGIFATMFLIVMFGPFLILAFMFAGLSSLLSIPEATISQRQEYLADQFALSLDAGEGLLTFLYEDMRNQENFWKISTFGGMSKSTVMSIYRTHPASDKRIKRLEKIMKKEGSLKVIAGSENKLNKWMS